MGAVSLLLTLAVAFAAASGEVDSTRPATGAGGGDRAALSQWCDEFVRHDSFIRALAAKVHVPHDESGGGNSGDDGGGGGSDRARNLLAHRSRHAALHKRHHPTVDGNVGTGSGSLANATRTLLRRYDAATLRRLNRTMVAEAVRLGMELGVAWDRHSARQQQQLLQKLPGNQPIAAAAAAAVGDDDATVMVRRASVFCQSVFFLTPEQVVIGGTGGSGGVGGGGGGERVGGRRGADAPTMAADSSTNNSGGGGGAGGRGDGSGIDGRIGDGLFCRSLGFVHIPKTGGSSVVVTLGPLAASLGLRSAAPAAGRLVLTDHAHHVGVNPDPQDKYMCHVTAVEQRKLFGPAVWHNAHTFSVMRHPLAWLVSSFFFAVQRKCVNDLPPHGHWAPSKADVLFACKGTRRWWHHDNGTHTRPTVRLPGLAEQRRLFTGWLNAHDKVDGALSFLSPSFKTGSDLEPTTRTSQVAWLQEQGGGGGSSSGDGDGGDGGGAVIVDEIVVLEDNAGSTFDVLTRYMAAFARAADTSKAAAHAAAESAESPRNVTRIAFAAAAAARAEQARAAAQVAQTAAWVYLQTLLCTSSDGGVGDADDVAARQAAAYAAALAVPGWDALAAHGHGHGNRSSSSGSSRGPTTSGACAPVASGGGGGGSSSSSNTDCTPPTAAGQTEEVVVNPSKHAAPCDYYNFPQGHVLVEIAERRLADDLALGLWRDLPDNVGAGTHGTKAGPQHGLRSMCGWADSGNASGSNATVRAAGGGGGGGDGGSGV